MCLPRWLWQHLSNPGSDLAGDCEPYKHVYSREASVMWRSLAPLPVLSVLSVLSGSCDL